MKLLTIPEVAKILRYSENKVYRLVKEGIIPNIRLGGPSGKILVEEETLENHIREMVVSETIPRCMP